MVSNIGIFPPIICVRRSQDAPFDLLDHRARLDAELDCQVSPQVGVHAERLTPLTVVRQGPHQLRREALVRRMLQHERAQGRKRCEGVAATELGLDVRLERHDVRSRRWWRRRTR